MGVEDRRVGEWKSSCRDRRWEKRLTNLLTTLDMTTEDDVDMTVTVHDYYLSITIDLSRVSFRAGHGSSLSPRSLSCLNDNIQ